MESNVTFPFGPVNIDRDSGLLILLEMANNHQGQVSHGVKICEEMGKVCRERNVQAGMKLQFRLCDRYLHPGYTESKAETLSNPLATRFMSTAMSYEEYFEIVQAVRANGMVPFSTPWDEPTVEWCARMELPVIKVASCFIADLPLLRAIAQTKIPVIASVGGAATCDVDRVVELFGSENIPLMLLHCVAKYPVETELICMDQVRQLRLRYPGLVIGYSGHEAPTDLHTVTMAVAAGAASLERHVGVPTDTITLNKYSMNPQQVGQWLDQALLTKKAMAFGEPRPFIDGEAEALAKIQRGMYAAKAKEPGEFIGPDDVFLAMPVLPGQFTAADIDEVIGLPVPIGGLQPKMPMWREQPGAVPPEIRIASIMQRVRTMIADAKVSLSEGTEAVIQHFHGLDNFDEIGGILVNIVNREYAKMLIVMLPGQRYPNHHHVQKEETFHLLAGDLEVNVDGEIQKLKAGDSLTLPRGTKHAFRTEGGMILEEISTTYHKGDSIYHEDGIPEEPTARKTTVVI